MVAVPLEPGARKTPFDSMSDDERARYDKALQIADGVKLYSSAAGTGVAAQWRPYWEDLQKRGGIPQATALMLARYRMWKQGLNVPDHVMPELTPEQVAARRDQFINDPSSRGRLMDEDKAAIHNGMQRFYDDLVMKPTVPASIAAPGVEGVPQPKPPESIAAEDNDNGGV